MGELELEREGLYTVFSARACLPEEGLWSAWAVGEQGELRLGILEPCGECAVIRRRFSERMTKPLGTLLRGELRNVCTEETGNWRAAGECPFRQPWLRKFLQESGEYLLRKQQDRWWIAIPYASDQPFPLVSLFCFAAMSQIGNREYVLFCFDGAEWPEIRPVPRQ